jgi:hypothetical protein
MFDISKETYLKKQYKPIAEIIDPESSIVLFIRSMSSLAVWHLFL